MLLLVWGFAALASAEVRLPNGEYTETAEDLKVKVLGGYVTVARSWTNGRWYVNPAWTDLAVTFDSLDGSVKALDRAGSIYERSGNNVFVFDKRFFIQQTATGFRWFDQLGNWITYDATGHMTAYGDRNNVKVSFQLDATGRRTQVIDHFNAPVMSFQYNGTQLESVTDRTGRQVRYGYTGGRLTQVVDVLGNTWTYGYDGNGQIASRTDPEGNKTTIVYAQSTPAAGTSTVGMYGYLANNPSISAGINPKAGGAASSVASTGSTPKDYKIARVFTVTDAEGHTTTYLYNYDRTTLQYSVTQKFPAGRQVTSVYDRNGWLVREVVGSRTVRTLTRDGDRVELVADERGLVTRTEYDSARNPLKITYPDGTSVGATYDSVYSIPLTSTNEAGTVTRFNYNASGNLLSRVEAAGLPEERTTTFTYDQYGQRLTMTRKGVAPVDDAITSYSYDAYGNIASAMDPLKNVTEYAYDAMGNAVTRKDPRGNTYSRAYDARGMVLSETDPLGHTTTLSRNKVGAVTRLKDAAGSDLSRSLNKNYWTTSVTDALGGVTQFEYDGEGKRTKKVDPNGSISLYTYDLDGRALTATDGFGETMRRVYGDASSGLEGLVTAIVHPSFTQEFKYDQRSRRTLATEVLAVPGDPNYAVALRQTNAEAYDNRGNVISRIDPLGRSVQIEYDALNRPVRVVDALANAQQLGYDVRDNVVRFVDATGRIHLVEYDLADRATKQTRPSGKLVRHVFDTNGNMLARISPAGQQRRFTYDAANRLASEEQYDANGALKRTVTYSYDARNFISGYNDGTTSANYVYDAIGNRISESFSFGPFSKQMNYAFGPSGQKSRTTYPDGESDVYGYDSSNRLQSITTPGGTINFQNYLGGLPRQVLVPGVTKTMLYDEIRRPTRMLSQANGSGSAGSPQGPVIMDYRYAYNAGDSITLRTTEEGMYAYEYDALDRLTGVTPPAVLQASAANPLGLPVERYTHDGVGNRLTSAHQPGSWTYSADNELLAEGQGVDAVSFAYNADGHMASRTNSSGTRTFAYDAAERMIEVRDNGVLVASYAYDPLGRRISKTAAGSTTYFMYSPQGIAAEFNSVGQLTRGYGWNPLASVGSGLQYVRSGSALNFSHDDVIGTAQRFTNSVGAITWAARADGFGKARVDLGSTMVNPLRFPGQYFDDETGLHYNVARYYDPDTGRYLAEDPLGIGAGPNAYLYGFANPIRNIDPFGLDVGKCITIPTPFDASGCYLVDIIQKDDHSEYEKMIQFRVLQGWVPWPDLRDTPKPNPAGPSPFPYPGPPGSPGSGVTIGPSAPQIATIYIDPFKARLGLFADLMQMFRKDRTEKTWIYKCSTGPVCQPSDSEKRRTMYCESPEYGFGKTWWKDYRLEWIDMSKPDDPFKP